MIAFVPGTPLLLVSFLPFRFANFEFLVPLKLFVHTYCGCYILYSFFFLVSWHWRGLFIPTHSGRAVLYHLMIDFFHDRRIHITKQFICASNIQWV